MGSWRWIGPGLVAWVALSTGCAPSVSLRVLRPAEVPVPPHVETVAVVDRSQVGNVGEGILGAIEGMLTGEALTVDLEGRAAALGALGDGLAASPRYDVVDLHLDAAQSKSSLFDEQLDWDTAESLCAKFGCEAIVALEAFDSDSRVETDSTRIEEEDEDGDKHVRVEYSARRETDVLAAWRLYDVQQRKILDDLRDHMETDAWSADGDSEREAIDNLPSQYDTVCELAIDSGAYYARHIAPSYDWVRRSYFGAGDPLLKQARARARADDWDGARSLWEQLLGSTNEKVRGKAAHCLAVAAEVEGDLRGALQWATRAVQDLDVPRTRSYRWALEQRLVEQGLLEDQMQREPAPGEPHPGKGRP